MLGYHNLQEHLVVTRTPRKRRRQLKVPVPFVVLLTLSEEELQELALFYPMELADYIATSGPNIVS